VATKMSDGRGLVSRNISANHGPVIIDSTSEIAVNNRSGLKGHLILLLSMQCISQCLNCCLA